MTEITSGNSADGKRDLAERVRRKKYNVEGTPKISFKTTRDNDILHKIFKYAKLENMKWLVNYDVCANEECNDESTSQYHPPIKLKDATEMIEPLPKDL